MHEFDITEFLLPTANTYPLAINLILLSLFYFIGNWGKENIINKVINNTQEITIWRDKKKTLNILLNDIFIPQTLNTRLLLHNLL